MHTGAKNLIGKSVQKIETTKRGIVKSVENGWTQGTTILIFDDGYKGMYSDRDIGHMIVDGRHTHQIY